MHVDLIHRQLECLKYVGGLRDGRPSGQGVDLDIVLLPDLLLDFRSFYLNPEEASQRNPAVEGGAARTMRADGGDAARHVCAVGGRAGRAACVLQHLASDDDGTYRVHLLAKTGNLGRLLLENEFHETESEHSLASVCLEGVVVRPREPRCALRTAEGAAAKASKATGRDEISAGDLRAYRSLLEMLRSARTVYLASVKTPDFRRLLKLALDEMACPGSGLFLDLAHAEQEHLDLLNDVLDSTLNGEEQAKILGVFLPEDVRRRLFPATRRPRDLKEVSAALRLPVIHFGDGQQVAFATSGDKVDVTTKVQFRQEGIPERFRAGVLLASTLWQVVDAGWRKAQESERLGTEDPERRYAPLYRALSSQWGKRPWETILSYGVGLASAGTDQRGHSTLAYLPGVTAGCDHLLPNEVRLLKDFRIGTEPFPGSTALRVTLSDDEARGVARLAGVRRAHPRPSRGQGDEARAALGALDPAPAAAPPSRAVMVDLDATLLDTQSERQRAVAIALREIPSSLTGGVPPDQVGPDLFEALVYDPWKLYLAMGLGNFRQEWNYAGWYAMYIALAGNQGLAQEVHRIGRRRLPGGRAEISDRDLVPLHIGERGEAPWVGELRKAYEAVRTDHRDAIRAAEAAFAGVKLRPFKEARDLLRTLELAGDYDVYIVSEGMPEAQWQKIRGAGLDDLLHRQHLLTTGDAAQPVSELEQLKQELASLEVDAGRLDDGLRSTEEGYDRLTRTERDVLTALPREHAGTIAEEFKRQMDEALETIRRFRARKKLIARQRNAADFVALVLDKVAHKDALAFYAHVVRAILRDPDSTRDSLRSFDTLTRREPARRSLQFAMVGDRYAYDIAPPLQLLGHDQLVAIRLLSPRYAGDPAVPAPGGRHAPTFVADTLAQVKAIILSPDTWKQVACAEDPPLYNWAVVVDGPDGLRPQGDPQLAIVPLQCVRDGIDMALGEFQIVPKVCAGVLAEHLRHCDPTAWARLLDPHLAPVEKADLDAARHGICLLWRLVEAGVLGGDHLQALAEPFVKQLGDYYDAVTRLAAPTERAAQAQAVRRALEIIVRTPGCPHHAGDLAIQRLAILPQ